MCDSNIEWIRDWETLGQNIEDVFMNLEDYFLVTHVVTFYNKF